MREKFGTVSDDEESTSNANERAPMITSHVNTSVVKPKSSQRQVLCLILCAGLALLLISIGLIDSFHADDIILTSSIDESDYYTIIINTYLRNDLLMDALDHYSHCPHAKHIHVVWSESPSVPFIFDRYKEKGVIFDIFEIDSLNNRFNPPTNYITTGIFAVDDDMRVSCSDLSFAHSVWKSSPYSLVGFLPRLHVKSDHGDWTYRCWWKVWWTGQYSIVLTKAAFVHIEYLEAYSSKDEVATLIRDYVDKHMNCEDIAMQFLASHISSRPPILVQGSLSDLGVLNGISTRSNVIQAKHMDSRSDCLNDLVSIFHNEMPLIETSIMVRNAKLNYFDLGPSTLYEFVSSDLWNFS